MQIGHILIKTVVESSPQNPLNQIKPTSFPGLFLGYLL